MQLQTHLHRHTIIQRHAQLAGRKNGSVHKVPNGKRKEEEEKKKMKSGKFFAGFHFCWVRVQNVEQFDTELPWKCKGHDKRSDKTAWGFNLQASKLYGFYVTIYCSFQ